MGTVDKKTKRFADVQATDISGFPSALKNLVNAEVNQLENIDATTITSAQWGYVGGADQAVKTTDTPTFDGAELGSGDVNTTGIVTVGHLKGLERSSDPLEPAEGEFVIWMSDGTGKGDDGDIMIASKAGGTTNYGTLFDHSLGAAW